MGASDRHEDDDFPPRRPFGERGGQSLPEPADKDDRALPVKPSGAAPAQAPVSRS